MADFTLTLGDVEFQDFEIPDAIHGGGGQIIDLKKYAGGQRTADTFGPDDDALTWEGIFLDDTAEDRCQQIDAMRVAGVEIPLSFSIFSYSVIIRSFRWAYEKFYQIRYSIELEVVADNNQPVTEDEDNPESDMQADLDDAQGFDTDLGNSDFDSALQTVFGDVTGMGGSIVAGTVPQLTQLSAAVASAQGIVQDVADQADAAMTSFGLGSNFGAGLDPELLVTNLTGMASTANMLAPAFCAANTMTTLGDSIADQLTGF